MTDPTKTSTGTEISSSTDFSVDLQNLESPESEEYYYNNPDWSKWLGYYKAIPELKKAIDALATWTIGKGYACDAATTAILERLRGNGKDNDDLLFFNMFVVMKINGDSFTQIIRNDKNTLIDLKPLNPERVRVVFGKDGTLKRYDYFQNNQTWKKIKKEEILHLINDKIGDEAHGSSVVEACQWVIDARNEMLKDSRRGLHTSTIRIIEIDMDDTSKYAQIKRDYKEAIEKGIVLLLPKGTANIADFKAMDYSQHLEWIRYLENFFYQAVGIPRVIASSENYTEAASKVGYLSFEPVYTREQQILEAAFWNQLALRIRFNRPPSLSTMLQEEQTKNQSQTGFQQSEMIPGANE